MMLRTRFPMNSQLGNCATSPGFRIRLVLVTWLAAAVAVAGQHPRGDGLVPELMLIDLDGDGIRLTSAAEGVRFTFAAGGRPEQTGWTERGSRDSFIVIDQNRDGHITSAAEIIGGILGPPNGFEFLRAMAFGRSIGSGGTVAKSHSFFSQLLVWTDADRDGVSSENELQSLEYAGFDAIELPAEPQRPISDRHGNVITARGRAIGTAPGGRSVAVVTVKLTAGDR
jgi:hypothetical protein